MEEEAKRQARKVRFGTQGSTGNINVINQGRTRDLIVNNFTFNLPEGKTIQIMPDCSVWDLKVLAREMGFVAEDDFPSTCVCYKPRGGGVNIKADSPISTAKLFEASHGDINFTKLPEEFRLLGRRIDIFEPEIAETIRSKICVFLDSNVLLRGRYLNHFRPSDLMAGKYLFFVVPKVENEVFRNIQLGKAPPIALPQDSPWFIQVSHTPVTRVRASLFLERIWQSHFQDRPLREQHPLYERDQLEYYPELKVYQGLSAKHPKRPWDHDVCDIQIIMEACWVWHQLPILDHDRKFIFLTKNLDLYSRMQDENGKESLIQVFKEFGIPGFGYMDCVSPDILHNLNTRQTGGAESTRRRVGGSGERDRGWRNQVIERQEESEEQEHGGYAAHPQRSEDRSSLKRKVPDRGGIFDVEGHPVQGPPKIRRTTPQYPRPSRPIPGY